MKPPNMVKQIVRLNNFPTKDSDDRIDVPIEDNRSNSFFNAFSLEGLEVDSSNVSSISSCVRPFFRRNNFLSLNDVERIRGLLIKFNAE